MKVSILMLTYNAPRYVLRSILDVHKTKEIEYELIVVDNCSKIWTRVLVRILKGLGFIDSLFLNDRNSLFAQGNNIASRLVCKESTHFLLLNSDIRIINKKWLKRLYSILPEDGGISSFGAVTSVPRRADGYCMLINRFIYEKYLLDEEYEWWWSVTKLESEVLHAGYQIVAVVNHENYIHHYGGASGKGYTHAKGMDVKIEDVKKWFDNYDSNITLLQSID